MTFLELFAWMKENQQFHMEQLGDAHYEAFFRLLGFEREGRRPAGILAMGKPEGEWSIPAGARFQTGGIIFETVEEETLTDALTEQSMWEKTEVLGRRWILSVRRPWGRCISILWGKHRFPGIPACFYMIVP